MSYFKEKGKVILLISFGIFLIVQQIAMQYGRSYRKQNAGIDSNGNDTVAIYEVSQLQQAWRKAAVDDLITPRKLADQKELKLAHARLKEAEIEIQNSEKRVEGIVGERGKFFRKVHAYYYHSASALIAIIDFLLAKNGEYTVKGNEINFESEADGDSLRTLINHLSDIHREKQELDAYILQTNREIEKKLSSR